MADKIHVGVDVAKKTLDVHLHPINMDKQLPNDKAGIQALIQFLKPHAVELVVLEATGTYGQGLRPNQKSRS